MVRKTKLVAELGGTARCGGADVMAREQSGHSREIGLRLLDPRALFLDDRDDGVRGFVAGEEFRLLTAMVQRVLCEEMTRTQDDPLPEAIAFVEEARRAARALLADLQALSCAAASKGNGEARTRVVACDPEAFDSAEIHASRRALLLLGLYGGDYFGAEGTRVLYELLAVRHSAPWMAEDRWRSERDDEARRPARAG